MAGGATKSFYTASILYEFGKAQYINVDQDAATKGVEEGDVRLTATVPNLQGDIMAAFGNPGKVAESMSVTPAVARPGEKVDVVITVKNISTKVGSALVETKVDDVLVDARGTPTLAVNEVAKVMFSMPAPMEVGRHKIQTGDVTFILDVEGEAVQSGPSQAQFDALANQVKALQDQLARVSAAQAAQPAVQPLASEIQTEKASSSPLVLFAGLLVALAVVLRRRA
jgi:sulfate adenylyltransferase subunit 1 (EFTu-like GTPase family)